MKNRIMKLSKENIKLIIVFHYLLIKLSSFIIKKRYNNGSRIYLPGTKKNYLSYYSQMRKMTHKEVMTTKSAKSQFAIYLMIKFFILYWIKGLIKAVFRVITYGSKDWHMNCIFQCKYHSFMIA